MLTIHALTTQLKSQTLKDPQPGSSTSTSSLDENAVKMRHHSEPHPPSSLLTDSSKKVKIITFKDGVVSSDVTDVCVSSILLAAPDTSSSWECSNSNPPNKRQCRSMSIPNDGELHIRWLQTQARGRLHRPLAVRPGSGGSRSKLHQRNSQSRLPHLASLAPSDSNTPPESPRSRPSSASSGFFESPLTSSCNLSRNRCESLQMLPLVGSKKCDVHNSTNSCVLSAKSMPSVSGNSLQTSPHKQRLLRCQSQPCVARERRYGIKRRHEDEQNRPSINFNKMTETAYIGNVVHASKTLDSSVPLTIKPAARYGLMFPDRVLQTIASSPQDVTSIASNLSHPEQLKHAADSPINDDRLSDSGCSTSDDELCDITNKMAETSHCCNDRLNKTNSNAMCVCVCDRSTSGPDPIFDMEPTQDGEIDLDMIENN